jgi:hypothetical protein
VLVHANDSLAAYIEVIVHAILLRVPAFLCRTLYVTAVAVHGQPSIDAIIAQVVLVQSN